MASAPGRERREVALIVIGALRGHLWAVSISAERSSPKRSGRRRFRSWSAASSKACIITARPASSPRQRPEITTEKVRGRRRRRKCTSSVSAARAAGACRSLCLKGGPKRATASRSSTKAPRLRAGASVAVPRFGTFKSRRSPTTWATMLGTTGTTSPASTE